MINPSAGTITATMPYGTNITTLSPTITLSSGATISPQTGIPQNFTNPITYIVTAENGVSTKSWIANVSTSASIQTSLNDIQLFYDGNRNQIIVKCSGIRFNAQLFNVNGTLIDAFEIDCNQEKHIDNISKGVYFVKLQNNKTIQTLKFVL